MDSLYLLIPVALVVVFFAVRLLLWAIDSGQYDDLDKEAWRILSNDPTESEPTETADANAQLHDKDEKR